MDQLNSNLISGVVSPDDATAESPAADHVDNASFSSPSIVPDDFIDTFVTKAVDRLADQLRLAEERGYARALDDAKARAASLENRSMSRPNFLVDTRPDFWSPEACTNK